MNINIASNPKTLLIEIEKERLEMEFWFFKKKDRLGKKKDWQKKFGKWKEKEGDKE